MLITLISVCGTREWARQEELGTYQPTQNEVQQGSDQVRRCDDKESTEEQKETRLARLK